MTHVPLVYARHGSTCLSSVVLSDSTPVYWFSDAEAFKVVSTEIGVLYEKDMVLVRFNYLNVDAGR